MVVGCTFKLKSVPAGEKKFAFLRDLDINETIFILPLLYLYRVRNISYLNFVFQYLIHLIS